MARETKARLTIETKNYHEARAIGERIHKLLVGNEDYIKSNIILNVGNYEVNLYVFEECKTNVFKVLGA